ncbi:hypothetical protein ACHAW5_005300 [Stephanodiscus triporus]|uniref:HMG box domain-containing protein n=1 Tax=Stephanodiscus triporus TaxID=2934178 RepID=A0ABD3QRH5_9STRA
MKKKDPNAPKRANSAYMYFSAEKRAEIKTTNPDMKFGDIQKVIGAVWKELTTTEWRKWYNMALKDKDCYRQEIADYRYRHNKEKENESNDSVHRIQTHLCGQSRVDFLVQKRFQTGTRPRPSLLRRFYHPKKGNICALQAHPHHKQEDELISIIGNMFDESSSPAFFKIDQDKIGSCYAILEHAKIPAAYRPKIDLQADSVKNTAWEKAEMEIALIAIPTFAPIPYGTKIKSTSLDFKFVDEMLAISAEHGFWAQTLNDVIDQHENDNDTNKVTKRMKESIPASSSHDPARAATKGIRSMTFASSPFVDLLLLSRFNDTPDDDQAKLRDFFCRNPTPTRVEEDVDDDNKEIPEVPVAHSTTTEPPTHLPPRGNPPPEFYAQLIETMKIFQAPQQPTKIVVESRDHEETIDLAKLQNGMLQLIFATGDINWDEDGTVKNV